MTRYISGKVVCAVCGAANEIFSLASVSVSGSPDLDLRPPERQRSTMDIWVQQCRKCAYCAYGISKCAPDSKRLIETGGYRRLKDDERYPELARKFLLLAILNEGRDPNLAAIARLHAAWSCDDDGAHHRAVECRLMAIEYMRSRMPPPDTEEGITEGAVYVDMLRRVGNFSEAISAIDALLAHPQSLDVIKKVLLFQRNRCEEEDSKCYTVADAAD